MTDRSGVDVSTSERPAPVVSPPPASTSNRSTVTVTRRTVSRRWPVGSNVAGSTALTASAANARVAASAAASRRASSSVGPPGPARAATSGTTHHCSSSSLARSTRRPVEGAALAALAWALSVDGMATGSRPTSVSISARTTRPAGESTVENIPNPPPFQGVRSSDRRAATCVASTTASTSGATAALATHPGILMPAGVPSRSHAAMTADDAR